MLFFQRMCTYAQNRQAVSNLTNFTIFRFSLSRITYFTILTIFRHTSAGFKNFTNFHLFSLAFYKFCKFPDFVKIRRFCWDLLTSLLSISFKVDEFSSFSIFQTFCQSKAKKLKMFIVARNPGLYTDISDRKLH